MAREPATVAIVSVRFRKKFSNLTPSDGFGLNYTQGFPLATLLMPRPETGRISPIVNEFRFETVRHSPQSGWLDEWRLVHCMLTFIPPDRTETQDAL